MSTGTGIKDRIFVSMMTLMETKPFHEVKITELCGLAKISRSTFYVYFDSVYDVLQKIEDEFFNGLLGSESFLRSNEDVYWPERARGLSMVTALYLSKHRKTIQLLLGENGDKSFEARLTNRCRLIFNDLRPPKKTCSALEWKLRCEYSSCGLIGLLKWWCKYADDIAPDEWTILVHKCLSNPIFD